ncbi:MAG TPA: 4-hydroxybenzoate octaprenyltransferase [Porticoccaceae bacterium]|nr:4-hydroxybenzoate octaprenyltransferase [Porticoccaceae bacterium]
MTPLGESPVHFLNNPWLRLVRMDRPIGIYLLLWPTLWALWFAGSGKPSVSNVVIFVLGMLVMRAAGCVINDYADRHVDGLVERTKSRPLPSGEITPKQALWLFFALLVIALLLVLMTNSMTIALSFGGLAITAFYPFMKRFTNLPQLGLGVAWAWVVPMAFAAEQQALPVSMGFIIMAIVAWTIAFDTYYAMVDRDDDLVIGVRSTAILFGRYDRAMIAVLQTVTILSLMVVGVLFQRGLLYFFGLILATGFFYRQFRSTANGDRQSCFAAFLNNHRVGMVIFVALAVDYWFEGPAVTYYFSS